jgi:hypothetical protein
MKNTAPKLRSIHVWTMAGCVAAGMLLGGGISAQEVLPSPEPPFKGQIGLSIKDSKSDFPKPVVGAEPWIGWRKTGSANSRRQVSR